MNDHKIYFLGALVAVVSPTPQDVRDRVFDDAMRAVPEATEQAKAHARLANRWRLRWVDPKGAYANESFHATVADAKAHAKEELKKRMGVSA